MTRSSTGSPTIIEQMCEALVYLHAQGWIHRDVKPDNFLVSEEGNVKLIDFALAQRLKGGISKLLGPKGRIQGTRSYMSPEQIRGGALDGRADLYSLACTLYELLGGKPPYTGANANDLLLKHLRAAVPTLESANHNVTPEFGELIRRSMAKKASSRPKSIEDFLTDFRMVRVFRRAPKIAARGRKKPTRREPIQANPWPVTSTGFRSNNRSSSSRLGSRNFNVSCPQGVETRDELRRLGRELTTRKKEIYSQLRPSETVDVARHPNRPMTTDYLELAFDEFVELHGDKTFGDDRAIRTGWAKLDAFKVMVVGHQKGRNLKERNACYFGCAHPEGYRKAMAKMRLAAKFHMPVDLLHRHAGRLSGHRGRRTRPGPGDRHLDARNVPAAHADHLRRDRRRRLRRRAGHRRRRPRRHARTRLLLGHQPRRLRRHPLEKRRLQGTRRPRP